MSDEPDNNECFVICALGEPMSPTRVRADKVLKHIITPALAEWKFEIVRADRISAPGTITTQIIQHLMDARLVIADLTESNPNVFYELAIRHAAHQPVVVVSTEGDDLPFDTRQERTIFFDHTDLDSVAAAIVTIHDTARHALAGEFGSPVSAALTFAQLSGGNALEQVVSGLAQAVERKKSSTASAGAVVTGWDSAVSVR